MGLNDKIELLNSIFSKHGVKYKMPKVHGNRQASEILSMYGGVGSINDIFICKANGHNIEINNETEVNEQVVNLLSSIYTKCDKYPPYNSNKQFNKK